MNSFNVAIFGCGTVGGGVAKIIQEINNSLADRAGTEVKVTKIVELNPKAAAERFALPIEIFCGGGSEVSKEDAGKYIQEVLNDPEVDLVVETIGGTSDFVRDLCVKVCEAGKHLVTANKALLAEKGKPIFDAAEQNNVSVGFEAAVCGAIPIIKTIKESFSGDVVESVSGIMNGTSNYILSRMLNEKLSFDDALKLAQDAGYAEADPTLDINGGDAAHKIIILMKLIFGIDVSMEELQFQGIQSITKDDMDFADEIDCKIKLICYGKNQGDTVYGTVAPMMVKKDNFLSEVNGATNAVRATNRYAGKHILVGEGAGSSETASSIVADIVFIARYNDRMKNALPANDLKFKGLRDFTFPYVVIFETEDKPGITGTVTTAIGNQNINIDTVSHNRHSIDHAYFSVATMPCTLKQIEAAIEEIKSKGVLKIEPKIFPILY